MTVLIKGFIKCVLFFFSDKAQRLFKCKGKDPKRLRDFRFIRTMPEKSRKKCLKIWNTFVKRYQIAINKAPTENDFYDFFEEKFKAGCKSEILEIYYWHLNRACEKLYGKSLKKIRSHLLNPEAKNSLKNM